MSCYLLLLKKKLKEGISRLPSYKFVPLMYQLAARISFSMAEESFQQALQEVQYCLCCTNSSFLTFGFSLLLCCVGDFQVYSRASIPLSLCSTGTRKCQQGQSLSQIRICDGHPRFLWVHFKASQEGSYP